MNGEDGKAERRHIFAMDGAIVFGAYQLHQIKQEE